MHPAEANTETDLVGSRFPANRIRGDASGTPPHGGGDSTEPRGTSDAGDHGYLHRFVVRDRKRYVLIRADEVDWIEAAGNYVRLHHAGEELLIRATMKSLEAELDPRRFARIHRSTIVNLDRVAEIRQAERRRGMNVVLHDGTRLRLSRTYRKHLLG